MKNALFLDLMTPRGSYKNRRFGEEQFASPWFATRMYLTTDEEECLLQRHLCRLSVTVEALMSRYFVKCISG
jgi:hypothetical protein